jgi:energy-coupling factor transporter ATP-binding protein EcfA2
MIDAKVVTRLEELRSIVAATLEGEGLLILGEPGAGKSTLAQATAQELGGRGYSVAVAGYDGSAKETLEVIAAQLGVDTMTDDEKPRQKTAAQLREDLLERMRRSRTVLIADDAHRWSATLRYWLEGVIRQGGLVVMFAYEPPRKDVFLKLPKLELQPLTEGEMRHLMTQQAEALNIRLTPSDLAELANVTGRNPALATRIVRETALGIAALQSPDHFQYVDGTPILVGLLGLLGAIRFIGLGLGDKALYILGGLLTLGIVGVRGILFAANRRQKSV